MKTKITLVNCLLTVALLIMVFQMGCSTAVKKPLLIPIESGIGLSEILDPNQMPNFRDNFEKGPLLESIDNSLTYFKKFKSYPKAFNSIGFSSEKQMLSSLDNIFTFIRSWMTFCVTSFFSKSLNLEYAISAMMDDLPSGTL